MTHRLTTKQTQVLAAVAAGIVRAVEHQHYRSTTRHRKFVLNYFVGKENITSVVRSLRYRGLIKGEEKLEVL